MQQLARTIGILALMTGTALAGGVPTPSPLNVNVTNTPVVDVLSIPPVSVAAMPDVSIATMPNVTIANPSLPVSIQGTPSVAVTGAVVVTPSAPLEIAAPAGMNIPVRPVQKRFSYLTAIVPNNVYQYDVNRSGVIESLSVWCKGYYLIGEGDHLEYSTSRIALSNFTMDPRDAVSPEDYPFSGFVGAPQIFVEIGAYNKWSTTYYPAYNVLSGINMPFVKRSNPDVNKLQMHLMAPDGAKVSPEEPVWCYVTLNGYFTD